MKRTCSNQIIYVIAVSKEEREAQIEKKNFCNKNDEKFPNSVGSTQEERN